jgi:uncharacterized membrane protein YphA (DoxX/SURF4 family)
MPNLFDHYAPPRNETGLAASLGLFLLRFGAGFILFYVEGWNLAIQVWQHLWQGAPWTFIDTITNAQLPLPKILAVVMAIVIVLSSVSWILGFVTRFASIILLPVMALAVLIANRTGVSTPTAEAAALYFFIALCLLISGPGWCSLDALFKMRRGKKSIYV